jgi:hypothetical protein
MAIIPSIRRFKRGDRQYERANQIWMILAGFIMNAENTSKIPAKITYGDLALMMGYGDKRAGHTLSLPLGLIGKLCTLNQMPCLNAIVVNQDTLQPGADVILTSGNSIPKEQKLVQKYDWYGVKVPSPGTFRKVLETHFQ